MRGRSRITDECGASVQLGRPTVVQFTAGDENTAGLQQLAACRALRPNRPRGGISYMGAGGVFKAY